ncbi:heme ABC transporter ATP-binding protein [Bifidobacterium vansinderenii]|uniref:Hemin ABC transporter ATP-binding protein n=1 Tax=Bifidobacterium vansinderenii TaxID=1984871 RepID=A0A229W020_9BIFI|nr:heme ABC transporter ATP-binding protein [Bifidobacterium vansinderenii]OXN01166.1 hemin ABC transporter ATP-binding protein [Bifidobacterium vansinderenii]
MTMTLSLPWRTDHLAPDMPKPGDCVLELSNVSVSIGERAVLRGVALDVRAGELLALVGPNGAGKSTLLNAITGDVPLTDGEISLFGKPAGVWDSTELAMRRSVLLQSVDVTFPFSVRDIVRMGRAPWEGTAQEMNDDVIVDDAMATTEVTALADRVYASLSGGERGRAAFSRVLAQTAPILLLDEPTAAMDVKHQEMLMRVGREYAAAGCAVVVIVHALDAAAAWADRVALLERGRLRALGTPEEVLTPQLLSDVYQCPIDVLRHPDGGLIIVPGRPVVARNVYGRCSVGVGDGVGAEADVANGSSDGVS